MSANGATTGAVTMEAAPNTAGWPQGLILAGQGALPTMGAVAFVPVLPLMMAEFADLPNAAYLVPALLAAPGVCIALLSPLGGWIGDRLGRRIPLIIALAVYALTGIAPLVMHSYGSVLAARVVLGMCEAVVVPLSAAMLGDYFSGYTRDRWIATLYLLAGISGIVFTVAGGVIGSALGWRAVSIVYALSLVFVPLMIAFTWEPLKNRPRASATGAANEPFPWRHASYTAIASLVTGTLLYAILFQQPLVLTELGVADPARIGIIGAVGGLAIIIGHAAYFKLMKVRVAYLLAAELTVIGAGMFGMAHAPTDVLFVGFVAAAMFGCGLLMPTVLAWTVAGFTLPARGRGTGLSQAFFSFGQFTSGLLVTFLAHNVAGTTQAAFAYVGVGALLCALVGFGLIRNLPAVKIDAAPTV